jgi:hypothetical protein
MTEPIAVVFFASIPAWGWFDILFTLMVLLGICGETRRIAKCFVSMMHPRDIPILLDWRIEKLKKPSQVLLIVGIAGELVCLAFSIHESAGLNEQAARLEFTNLTLRVELEEAKMRQENAIALNEEKRLIKDLKDAPKGPIWIVYHNTGSFGKYHIAYRLYEILSRSGYTMIGGWSDFSTNVIGPFAQPLHLVFVIRDPSHPPRHLEDIENAFTDINVKTWTFPIENIRPFTVETNQIIIYVFNPHFDPTYHPLSSEPTTQR